jgi:hypothetical protein
MKFPAPVSLRLIDNLSRPQLKLSANPSVLPDLSEVRS